MAGERAAKCPLHEDVRKDLTELQRTQKERSCDGHTARLESLEGQETKQWEAIQDLQKTVWKGMGFLAAAGFFGSIIGGLVMRLIGKY